MTGGGSIGGGSSRSAYTLGGFGGGSFGRDGSDTRLQGPRGKNGEPLFSISHTHYGSDAPATDPVGILIDGVMARLCQHAPILCASEPPT